ncbi:MAG: hypothetical protein GY913_08020 [Proteobacteria bacterium]|nr:hypothetical protein [Pseudomonadota bacterium]
MGEHEDIRAKRDVWIKKHQDRRGVDRKTAVKLYEGQAERLHRRREQAERNKKR